MAAFFQGPSPSFDLRRTKGTQTETSAAKRAFTLYLLPTSLTASMGGLCWHLVRVENPPSSH